MPTAKLASFAVTLRGRSPDELDRALRAGPIAVVGRIEEDRLWLDVRTIAADELDEVAAAVRRLCG
jgi:L-seryl-tRNA(Ser) seleniumtransferase